MTLHKASNVNVTSDKVVLSKEQAVALEYALGKHYKEGVIRYHINHKGSWIQEAKPLNKLTLEDVICAIYIGYELEKSPEDRLIEVFEGLKKKTVDEDLSPMKREKAISAAEAIFGTLDTLNIKVKGINA